MYVANPLIVFWCSQIYKSIHVLFPFLNVGLLLVINTTSIIYEYTSLLTTMSLHDVLSLLVSHPEVQGALSLQSFVLFFNLIHHFKDTLAWTIDPAYSGPPNILPPNILSFLSATLGVSSHNIEELWHLLRRQAWDYEPGSNQVAVDVLGVIMKFGSQHEIGVYKP